MELFYTDKKHFTEHQIKLTGEEAHHIATVLRYKKGERIYVTDGEGFEYRAVVESVSEDTVLCTIVSRTRKPQEPLALITLAQGLIKAPRMDTLVEKTVELGVSEIIPVITQRSLPTMEGEGKIKRLQRIAISAMKTSTRSILPSIREPMNFKEVLAQIDRYQAAFLAWEGERSKRIADLITARPKRILLFIGPEGGFAQEEIDLATKMGVRTFSLGLRRLRAETAAISALSLLLYELGDM
jgi:16S rRNA (uracil1498-N3)-methyltransferase